VFQGKIIYAWEKTTFVSRTRLFIALPATDEGYAILNGILQPGSMKSQEVTEPKVDDSTSETLSLPTPRPTSRKRKKSTSDTHQ
jgi:hypothetical protein